MANTLSLDEAAAMLKTTSETVSDCIRSRGLPAAKIGRAWVLVDDDVISWLRQQYLVAVGGIRTAPRKTGAAALPRMADSVALNAALAPIKRSPRRRVAL